MKQVQAIIPGVVLQHAGGKRGQPVKRVDVDLRVGSMPKQFRVVGNRFWRKCLWFVTATRPEPFVKIPISYDNAFGGFDKSHPKPKKHRALMRNPMGRGFHSNLNR